MPVTIVFVHLGGAIPNYLQRNLQRTRFLFPENKVVLITNSNQKIINGITNFYYLENDETKLLFVQIEKNVNMSFRKGYWKFTLQRLFALAAYHSYNQEEKVLHVESDVILMPNIPLDKLSQNLKMSWMRVSPDHDIAALIYSPNYLESKWMIECIKNEVLRDHSLSDMRVMSRISQKHPKNVLLLPTLTQKSLRSSYPVDNYVLENEDLISLFGGYFDALGLGVWNCGLDPRHNYGFTKYFHDFPDYFLDPSKVSLSYSTESYLVDQYLNSIFSLHVHSKNLNLFSINWEAELISILKNTKKSHDFSFGKLIETSRDYPIRKWLIGPIKYMGRKIAAYFKMK